MNCYCGQTEKFELCCQPFLLGKAIPETAEKLMRSRYSAFASYNNEYILKTWYKKKKLKETNLVSPEVQWQRLEIINSNKGQQTDQKGTVEFKAYYLKSEEVFCIHEESQFIKERGLWFYAKGVHFNAG